MTKHTKSALAFLVPWLLSMGLWLAVSLFEHLNSYVHDEHGQIVPAGFRWESWFWMMKWYAAAVPCTVLLWSLSRRLVRWRRFWAGFTGLAFSAGLASVLWMQQMHATAGMGLGWLTIFVPRYAALLGCFVAYRHMRLAEEGKRELLASQLRMLRAQLQPHFLFNTLHAIGVTAKNDGATAARMTTLLGDLLRQTLRERRSGALVSLAEESLLLQPYVQLQQLRFGDRLRVDVDLPADVLGGALPDLMLQPLVENALQHGIEQRAGAGVVRVVGRRDGDQLVLDVHDDGVGLSTLATDQALGTGLGATKARLAALYGDTASLVLRGNEQGGTTATLRLPWREVAHAA